MPLRSLACFDASWPLGHSRPPCASSLKLPAMLHPLLSISRLVLSRSFVLMSVLFWATFPTLYSVLISKEPCPLRSSPSPKTFRSMISLLFWLLPLCVRSLRSAYSAFLAIPLVRLSTCSSPHMISRAAIFLPLLQAPFSSWCLEI